MDDETYAFGSFRLVPTQRLLLDGGRPVRLGSRALDILFALVESAGETVRNDRIMARAWPATTVDEAGLRVHIAALRKALGDGRAGNRFIANIPGRGYRFVAPVTRGQAGAPAAPADVAPAADHLPTALVSIIGRADTVTALAAQLDRRRLVTVVGPGGIGKTTVALAVAERVRASYADGVWFVALASLSDGGLVPSALRAALGAAVSAPDPLSGLAGWLRDKQALIVLDNCEHVVDAAAAVAEAILKTAPRLHVLATSREPLRAEGEWLHRLPPLEIPPDRPGLTAGEALGHSAVQLFNERAMACAGEFSLADADVPALCAICRKLDGLPLALELAAVQVDAFGIQGVAQGLSDRFALLTKGRRTALARQQTLRATLDWSYDLLAEIEKIVLRRLAVFRGDFTMDAAAAVAADDRLFPAVILEGVANLAAKSLIATDISGDITHHRLLDSTRAYASEKLLESGEGGLIAKRHAEYQRRFFERAEAEVEARPTGEWLAAYRPHIDDLRAALQWAFAPDGDASIGVALTVASIPLWINLSMIGECRRHVEHALANLTAEPDSQSEMRLHAALGMSLNYTTGPVSATAEAWTKTLEIAESRGDTEYRLRALRGLWAHHMNAGEYRQALAFAHRFRSLAATSAEPADLDFGDRMAAIILHYLGDQDSASRHLTHALARPAAARSLQASRFLLDRDVTVQALWSRILWLRGFSDQAACAARLAVDRALATGHGLSLCHALAQAACPVALNTGDLAWAEDAVAMLLDHAREQGLAGWIARGRCFRGMVMIRHEDFAAGLPLLRDALVELGESGAAPSHPAFLAALAAGLGRAGQVIDGLAAIDQALMLSERREERWCLPELLRSKGELHLLERSGEAAAEECLRQALDWAHRDGILAWELRVAVSLARLWHAQGRDREARELLMPVHCRFTEGFATADLRAANTLLDELA